MTTNLHDKMLAAIDAYFSASDAVEEEAAENLLLDVRDEIRKQPAQPLTDEQKYAARYRWLRNPTTEVALVLDKRTNWVPPDDVVPGVGGYWEHEYRAGEELDEAIDRAIEAAHGITKGNT
jgi:hypothetical protein